MGCETPWGQTPGFYETCLTTSTATLPDWFAPLVIGLVLAATWLLVRMARP